MRCLGPVLTLWQVECKTRAAADFEADSQQQQQLMQAGMTQLQEQLAALQVELDATQAQYSATEHELQVSRNKAEALLAEIAALKEGMAAASLMHSGARVVVAHAVASAR